MFVAGVTGDGKTMRSHRTISTRVRRRYAHVCWLALMCVLCVVCCCCARLGRVMLMFLLQIICAVRACAHRTAPESVHM